MMLYTSEEDMEAAKAILQEAIEWHRKNKVSSKVIQKQWNVVNPDNNLNALETISKNFTCYCSL